MISGSYPGKISAIGKLIPVQRTQYSPGGFFIAAALFQGQTRIKLNKKDRPHDRSFFIAAQRRSANILI
jgi:hypothetical protein